MGKPSCTWLNLLIVEVVIVGLVIGDGWATAQPAQAAGNEVAVLVKFHARQSQATVAGATVQAVQGSQVIASATTDTAGGYSIPNVDAGTYDMRATADGYLNQSTSNIVVHSGQTTANVNFALTR